MPQRVRVVSKKLPPKPKPSARPRRTPEEEDHDWMNADVILSSTQSDIHLPCTKSTSMGRSSDDEYYSNSSMPPPSAEERMEQIKNEYEHRIYKKDTTMRIRQGVARRPGVLVRTRYGRLKTIDVFPHASHPTAKPLAIAEVAHGGGTRQTPLYGGDDGLVSRSDSGAPASPPPSGSWQRVGGERQEYIVESPRAAEHISGNEYFTDRLPPPRKLEIDLDD